MSKSKIEGLASCLVTLDIKNAFNSVRRTDVLRLLMEYGVPPDLLGLIASFLRDRSVTLDGRDHSYNVGVPQGSCLGPILFVVLMNELLRNMPVDSTEAIQAYTDEVLVMLRSRAVNRFVSLSEPILKDIDTWATSRSLEISYGKCFYTVIPARGKVRYAPPIPMNIHGYRLEYARQIKYLGVTIDRDAALE